MSSVLKWIKISDFSEYWPKIDEKLKLKNETLGFKNQMARLNGSRVNLNITEYQ